MKKNFQSLPILNDILILTKRITRINELIVEYEALLNDIDSIIISKEEGITLIPQGGNLEVEVKLSTSVNPLMVDIGMGIFPHLECHEAVQVIWDLLYNLRFSLTSLQEKKSKIEEFAKENFISYDQLVSQQAHQSGQSSDHLI